MLSTWQGHSLSITQILGPDWTPVYVLNAGETIAEDGVRSFTKTGGVLSWDNAVHSAETAVDGFAVAQYTVAGVGASDELMVGMGNVLPATPFTDNSYTPAKSNISGIYQSAGVLMQMSAGGGFGVLTSGLVVGDVIRMERTGTTINVKRNGVSVGNATTTLPAGTYRGLVLFKNVGSTVDDVRFI